MRRIASAVSATVFVAVLLGTVEGWSAQAQKSRPLCFGKPATIVGTQRTDGIIGTPGADVIVSFGGSDAILALGGDDRVCSGPGNDEIEADASYISNPGGADMADGGPGRDTCRDAERTVSCEEVRSDLPHTGALRPGIYVSETFRPRVGFKVGSGWSIPFTTLYYQLLLSQRPDPGGLNLRFDSFGGQRPVATTIRRLARIRGVKASRPSPARLGRAVGQRIELHVTGADFVTIPGLSEAYELERNDRVRAYAVNVRGTTVSIFVEAPARDFARFTPIAQAVLASVRWS